MPVSQNLVGRGLIDRGLSGDELPSPSGEERPFGCRNESTIRGIDVKISNARGRLGCGAWRRSSACAKRASHGTGAGAGRATKSRLFKEP
jgi:hypothetical protein